MRRELGMLCLWMCLAAPLMAAGSVQISGGSARQVQFLTDIKGGEVCHGDVCAVWKTDLTLFNPWERPVKVDLTFSTPQRAIERSVDVKSGQQVELADVVATLFRASGTGVIAVSGDRDVVVRAYVYRPASTEGRYTQPVLEATADVIHAGESAELSRTIGDADGAQSAIVLANVGGGDADVEVDVANAQKTLSQSRHHLAASETIELSLRQLTGHEEHDVRVSARNLEGKGAVILSGSTRSTATGDGFHVAALVKAPAGTRRRTAGSGAILNGRVMLDLYSTVPQDDRQAIAQNRAMLEGNGYVVAADASRVDLPGFAAAGYRIRLGTSTANTDTQGRFSILVPPGGPASGQVFHPATPDALGTFTVAGVQSGAPVLLELQFGGVCGMNASDTQLANCHAPTASNIVNALGVTYPPTRRADACEQLDGFISSNTSPLASYFGSTCQKRVIQGCCPNEGGWGIFSATICCVKNHRGRYCQELSPGDIAILGDSSYIVDLAESDTFTLHNNGCFGDSVMIVASHDINGTLSGGGLAADHVEHYDATKLAAFSCGTGSNSAANQIWIGDRALTHTTPKCVDNVSGGEEDQYLFFADGIFIEVTFTLKPDLLYRFLGGNTTFSLNSSVKDGWHIAGQDTGCPSTHLHGNHPCTGLPDPAPHNCGWGLVQKLK